MKTLQVVALVMLVPVCTGCSGSITAPTGPQAVTTAPRLTAVDAHLEGSALIVDVRTNHPMEDVRAHDLQVFVDADDDPATGYGAHGDEYVARLLESRDALSFPLRHTETIDPADPAGWGSVSGIGWVGYGPAGLLLRIPLGTVGGRDGPMRVRVELYGGGSFDYRDVTADPALAATP
jgi:hypothetical protein